MKFTGYMFGTLEWSVSRFGEPPGHPECRAPRELLKIHGLL